MPQSTVDLSLPYKTRVHDALTNRHLKTALERATGRRAGQRTGAMAAVDGETLRSQVRQMKEHVMRQLPDYLEQLEARITENGGQVHWAKEANDVNRIVIDIARKANVQKVVKAKSMATEETHLNTALEQGGMKVVETDLGEYIIQLAGEPPSHIIAPVVHKRLEDIAELFTRELDLPPTLDPQVICAAARTLLRREFLAADMGISGCNFAIAETGTVCIVTNEGNGRMTSSLPRVYVVVMGLEKIVPTMEDAFLQYQALCRSATGQQCSVYLSMTSGPRKPGDVEGPAEFHVILMDNGRLDMLAKGYGEALCCIRCGACLNVCPVYREIGGHAYGSTYSGPIGAVISPLLHTKVTEQEQLPFASTLCGACRDACPVKIDLPQLLLDLRRDVVEEKAGWFDHTAIRGFANTMQSRAAYETAGKVASLATNVVAGFGGGNIKFMPGPLAGWTDSRNFPPFARRSFREQWSERQRQRKKISGAQLEK
jgi:L-lactate dehydrogenase complex protein LldF